MAYTLQNVKVSCRGGLDLRSTSQELLSKPGFAEVLQNFECFTTGGYRRINGYQLWGENQPPDPNTEPGVFDEIKGIYIFNDTVLIAKGPNLYHTFDGLTWVQVNKDVTSATYFDTVNSTDVIPMDESAETVRFASYTNGTVSNEQFVTIVNGVDPMMFFTITGTDHTNATYSFQILDPVLTSAPVGCKWVMAFKDQIYASGQADNPSVVYVSALFGPTDWAGTSSLAISTANEVTGLGSFRENFIVFCRESIFYLNGVAEANPELRPITRNIGCIHGDSIQEVGGDLMFLANDGVRNLAGTERIDDVELSTISDPVRPLLLPVIEDINNYYVTSTVIKSSSQYRLYYYRKDVVNNQIGVGYGLFATLSPNQQGFSFAWSSYKGDRLKHTIEGWHKNKYLSLCSIDKVPGLFQNNYGSSFNGNNIQAIMTTPYFDIGDPSIRKNIHRIKTYVKGEGTAEINLDLIFSGYTNETPSRPFSYPLGRIRRPSQYAYAEYNKDYTYGSRVINTKIVNTYGSGHTISLRYTSSGKDDPYNIQGFDLDFKASGKV